MADGQNSRIPDSTDPTRDKLLDAAGEVFADQGFQAATVRDICARAGANVASVNYYFGDKTGLYLAVLRQSICASDLELGQQIIQDDPEAALRLTIHRMFRKMIAGTRPSWAFRLMAHEMAQPTPALGQVIEEMIRPNYARLRAILSLLLKLPPEHETTRMCAHSIIGQVIHYVHARPVIGVLWPDLSMTAEQVEKLANHIADFSICSVKQLARGTK